MDIVVRLNETLPQYEIGLPYSIELVVAANEEAGFAKLIGDGKRLEFEGFGIFAGQDAGERKGEFVHFPGQIVFMNPVATTQEFASKNKSPDLRIKFLDKQLSFDQATQQEAGEQVFFFRNTYKEVGEWAAMGLAALAFAVLVAWLVKKWRGQKTSAPTVSIEAAPQYKRLLTLALESLERAQVEEIFRKRAFFSEQKYASLMAKIYEMQYQPQWSPDDVNQLRDLLTKAKDGV